MFEELELASEVASGLGLKPCHLVELQQVVVLCGPNGGGKSRFLRAVDRAYGDATHRPMFARREATRTRYRDSGHARVLPLWLPELVRTSPGAPPQGWDERLGLPLQRPAADIAQAFASVLAEMEKVAMAAFLSEHPRYRERAEFVEAKQRADEFERIVFELLGLRVGVEHSGSTPRPTLDGRTFNFGELSAGQRSLLAWAAAIHGQLNGAPLPTAAIILLDEPELHLHPEAAVRVVESIRSTFIKGSNRQLWIATHSPSLVAHLAPEADVYYVSDGKVEYANRRTAIVIKGLLGGETAREELATFIDDGHGAEIATYASQCLLSAMVSGRSGDKQGDQLVAVLASRQRAGRPVRVLDYCAGKGRMAGSLSDEPETLRGHIEYFTYDDPSHDEHRALREANVRRLYPADPDAAKRCRSERTDFLADQNVDVVIATNVFHELPPIEWRDHLHAIGEMLNDDGVLVVLEDQRPAVGELPHRGGHLLLKLADWRRLLGGDPQRITELTGVSEERCTVYVITAAALKAGTERWGTGPSPLCAVLRDVFDRATQDLAQLRANREARGAGLRHAQAVMQVANAALGLRELGCSS